MTSNRKSVVEIEIAGKSNKFASGFFIYIIFGHRLLLFIRSESMFCERALHQRPLPWVDTNDKIEPSLTAIHHQSQSYVTDCSIPSICSEDIGDCSDCSSIMSDLSDDGCCNDGGHSESIPHISILPHSIFDCASFNPLGKPVPVISPGTTPLPSVGGDDDSFFSSSVEPSDDEMSLQSSSGSFIESLKCISFTSIPDDLTKPLRPLTGDAISTLPDELIADVCSYLDVRSLCTAQSISLRFSRIAKRDEAGWARHCQQMWANKSLVCAEALSLAETRRSMKAFQVALLDAQNRSEIVAEELCYNAETSKGVIWDFRFKENAGTDWTSLDPWFRGGDARKMVFLKDGSVKQLVRSNETPGYTLHAPFYDVAHDTPARRLLQPSDRTRLSRLDMRWRFVSQPMDLPKRPNGAYLRLTVDGRDVPTYVVHRSCHGDWGFVIESCWGVFSSSALIRRNVTAEQPPDHQPRRPRMRLRRTRDGGRWLNVDGLESESEDEGSNSYEGMADPDEGFFSVSTRRQWREALLYNYGAVSLPEGEDARAEFDRVWNQSLGPRRR